MATSLHLFKHIWKKVTSAKGFDRVVGAVNLLSASQGGCRCELIVGEEHLSNQGVLSNGFVATLFDDVTSTAVATLNEGQFGSTVQLNASFIGSAGIGDKVIMDAEVVKSGRTLAFTKASLYHSNGDVIARGSCLMYLGAKGTIHDIRSVGES